MEHASAYQARLYILDPGGAITEVVICDNTRIGRAGHDKPAEISLPSSIVSRCHGVFTCRNGSFFYKDLDSSNGTYINNVFFGKDSNGKKSAYMLSHGDCISIDVKVGEIHHPEAVIMIFSTISAPSIWKTHHIPPSISQFDVGRKVLSQADICLDLNVISKRHATFFKAENGWAITDNNSTNGVFLNNSYLASAQYLKKLDVVRMGNINFVFLGDRILYQTLQQNQQYQQHQRQNLENRAHSYSSKDKNSKQLVIKIKERTVSRGFTQHTILKDINVTINSGEMVLILGGSGAGKTTFMNAVMGYEKADGQIIYNGINIYTEFKKMQHEIGFVPQQDLVRNNDSVYDTISNAASMKIVGNITDSERNARIEDVLSQLGLSRESHSLIGKLSGGQRKRLSIAMELISNPSLFFLDEPDSGLDGIMAKSLMGNLRQIADQGKIVMVITHGPDRVSEMFDKIIVLSKSEHDNCGRLAFFGSVDEGYRFFQTTSLEGIVQRVNNSDEGGDGRSDEFINKFRTLNPY